MAKRKDRLIIDTNLFISFLINNDFSKLDDMLDSRHVTLLLSKDLLSEIVEVTQRPKFRKYFANNLAKELLRKLYVRSELVEVSSEVSICNDPKDNFLLSLVKDGRASHLITGDRALLALEKFSRAKIITIRSYLEGR